jgi:hypothetical protein
VKLDAPDRQLAVADGHDLPVVRAIYLHILSSFSFFISARCAQIAELALTHSNSVNFMGSAR